MLRQMAAAGYAAPGDPAKMHAGNRGYLRSQVAPARLALGPDVYGYISTALLARLQQLEALKDVTMSTNCDDVEAR